MQRIVTLIFSVALLASVSTVRAAGPIPTPLWPGDVPNALGKAEPDTPSVRIYQPPKDKSNGTGVVICPGGGYGIIAMDHEGSQVAKFLNSRGITAFVLRYRLAPYRHPIPLNDAQRAIRYARANAESLGLSSKRIGVMGFSAGGHLASTAATHFDAGKLDAVDPVDRVSCRPDFAILGYPVISLNADFAHKGSSKNLLGDNPDPALLDSLSNDKQVTKETPPTFLFHTAEDTGVPPENSLAFFSALRKAKVPAELHIYQHGPHGVGLAPGDPALNTWKDRLIDWLRQNCLLADGDRAAISGTVNLNGMPLKWGQITLQSHDSVNAPIVFAMVHNGKFSVPQDHGALSGKYRVSVFNLGDIIHQQTIEDAKELTRGALVFQIAPKQNEMSLDLTDGQ
ncbi:MAG: axeA1 4 [Planctomycetaceae bacterium]|nr:axeA1 4 [Planctomycetaceae bacterium]